VGGVLIGPHKFHLHDADLPELSEVCAAIEASHAAQRPVAFHCVTRAELVFALLALREAGCIAGDRIEHAAVTPPDLLAQVAELGLTVVTQPNFIAERGDAYLRDVDSTDQPWLYRLRGFLEAGVALAGSTDAPFGDANPWKAMQAAVDRMTPAGAGIGAA
jgi:predicted amidohydrolase YtcJ